MFHFKKILSLSLIAILGINGASSSQEFGSISSHQEFSGEQSLIEGNSPSSHFYHHAKNHYYHSINKRNAFETLRELSFGSDFDDSTNSSKLTVNRRIYNSSVALTIPFFSFKIPHLSQGGFLANQAIFGVFAWGIVALPFFLSFIFTGFAPSDSQSRSFQRLSNTAKKSNFNFLGPDFSKSFGMDGLQCIQKVICQAHRLKDKNKYGLLASSIRTIFPIPENKSSEQVWSPSSFQSAAISGKSDVQDCDNLFDCILDPLGSARYLIHWYSHTYPSARFLVNFVDFDDDSLNSGIISMSTPPGNNSETLDTVSPPLQLQHRSSGVLL